MFKYICYDLESDTLIATNDEVKGYCMNNCPQQFEYFHSFKEAIAWLRKHPTAHQEYTKRIEDEYQYLYKEDIERLNKESFDEWLIDRGLGDFYYD